MRKINRQTMTRIRFQFWPKHFERNPETAPGGAYGYEKRTRKYQISKAKRAGHQKPLVLSGRMKQAVLSGAKITATAKRGRIKARNYFPMTVQRRSEVEAVSPREQKILVERAGRDYVRLINSGKG